MIQILLSCIPLIIFFIVAIILKLKIKNFVNIALLAFLSVVLVILIFNTIIGIFIPSTFLTLGGPLAFIYYLFYAGISEETAKFISLKLSKPKAKSQILINIILIGLLFGVIENYGYLNMDISYKAIFTRCFNMHILFGCIMGMLLVIGEEKNKKGLFNALALIIPIIVHGTWDFANGGLIGFIVSGIICYGAMIFALIKAKKYQSEEILEETPDKFKVLKIIVLVIITLLWLLAYSNHDSRTKLGNTCEYEDLEIKVLSAEKMTDENNKSYIRIKVEVKNKSSESNTIESGLGGFQLVRLDNGKVEMETISLYTEGERIDTSLKPNGTNTGYIFYYVPGEVKDYKLTYSKFNDKTKCNLNIK